VSTAYWEKYVWNPAELEWDEEEVTAAGFDPSQPRDERGRWSETGAESREKPTTWDIETLGSKRDPNWKGPKIGPKIAHYQGQRLDAREHSDNVWSWERTRGFDYLLDEDYGDPNLPTDPEYRKDVARYFADTLKAGELMITTPGDVVLDDIIESGRFKSQFETGSSGGALNPTARAVHEQLYFGYDQDMEPGGRPIYGWVDHPDAALQRLMITRQYGGLTWKLKDEVKDRTTVTALDSLSRPVIPGPYNNPGFRAAVPGGYADHGVIGAAYAISDPVNDTGFFDDIIEAQYHGGLTLDDVEELRVTVWEGFETSEMLADDDRANLERRGIRVRFFTEYGTPLEPGQLS
jgi:hypothetical protein